MRARVAFRIRLKGPTVKALRLLATCLALWPFLAHAVWENQGEQRYTVSGLSGQSFTTAQAACSAEGIRRFGAGTTATAQNERLHSTGQKITDCQWTGGALGGSTSTDEVVGLGNCSHVAQGQTRPGSGACWVNVASCTPPSVQTGDVCGPAPTECELRAGAQVTVNRTEGWARSSTPSAPDYVGADPNGPPVTWPTSLCDGTCVASIAPTALASCYRSQVPAANGLHRVSCEFVGTVTSQACSHSNSDTTSPTAPEPPCPGRLGAINGRPVCIDTSPLNPMPAASAPVAGVPQAPGNPAAGVMPTTGPGSGAGGIGRTPTVGSGGNAGGGSNSAIPGGGSEGNNQTGSGGAAGGTSERPADPCGLPGRPPCKIDETGTPDGSGAYTSANTAWNTAAQNELDGLNSPTRQLTATPWMWGFSPPTGVCTAISQEYKGRTYTFDPCNSSLVAFVRQVLGWFIALCGCIYIWRSVTNSVPSGGK